MNKGVIWKWVINLLCVWVFIRCAIACWKLIHNEPVTGVWFFIMLSIFCAIYILMDNNI